MNFMRNILPTMHMPKKVQTKKQNNNRINYQNKNCLKAYVAVQSTRN